MNKNSVRILLGVLCFIAIVVCVITLIAMIITAANDGTAERIVGKAEVLGIAALVAIILGVAKSSID
jgi:hypothetical protein